jgi:hypothetical protein
LEGLIAKRCDTKYEPGQRSGTWRKMRVNLGQEFVIGGYTIGGATFDALVFGYYDGGNLIYAARTRNGFTPKLRAELLKKFKPLEIAECPFANLPEKKAGRWGAGRAAAICSAMGRASSRGIGPCSMRSASVGPSTSSSTSAPSSTPKIAPILGWFSEASTCASRANRAMRSGSAM